MKLLAILIDQICLRNNKKNLILSKIRTDLKKASIQLEMSTTEPDETLGQDD